MVSVLTDQPAHPIQILGGTPTVQLWSIYTAKQDDHMFVNSMIFRYFLTFTLWVVLKMKLAKMKLEAADGECVSMIMVELGDTPTASVQQ